VQEAFDTGFGAIHTVDSARKGATGPRQGKNPTSFDSDHFVLNLLSACISGSQALMKGDYREQISSSCSPFS
jgi:hypothetical protein